MGHLEVRTWAGGSRAPAPPAPQRVRGSLSVAGVVGLVASPRALRHTPPVHCPRGPSRHQARGQCGGETGAVSIPEPSRGLWDTGRAPRARPRRFFVMEAAVRPGLLPSSGSRRSRETLEAISRGGSPPRGPTAAPGWQAPGTGSLSSPSSQCQWPYCAAEPWRERAPPGCQPTRKHNALAGLSGGAKGQLPKPVLTQRRDRGASKDLLVWRRGLPRGSWARATRSCAPVVVEGLPATPAQTPQDPVVSANPRAKPRQP